MTQQREQLGLHAMLENINTFVDGLVFYVRDNCDTAPTLKMQDDTVSIRDRCVSLSVSVSLSLYLCLCAYPHSSPRQTGIVVRGRVHQRRPHPLHGQLSVV